MTVRAVYHGFWLLVLTFNSPVSVRSAEIHSFDFSDPDDRQGWTAGFADYPVGEADQFELVADVRVLPSELPQEQALYLSGRNFSDDLFMFYKTRVDGLLPNALYEASFYLQFASQYEEGSFGIGGSPANSVFVKAGAASIEPLGNQPDEQDILRMNIDKGNQATAGDDAVLLGDVAKPADGNNQYVLVDRASDMPLTMRANAQGQAWLFFGTDSGFEGVTSLYFTEFRAEFVHIIPEPSSALLLAMSFAAACAAALRRPCGHHMTDC